MKQLLAKPTESKSLKTAIVLLTSLAITACGSKQNVDSKRQKDAPSSQEETGLVVSGLCKDEMAKLLEDKSVEKYRVVNEVHCLYEIWGMDSATLRTKINNPKVIIEKNKYVKVKSLLPKSLKDTPQFANSKPDTNTTSTPKHPLVQAVEEIQGVQLEGEAKTFTEGCKLDARHSPTILVKDNQGRDRQNAGIFFEIGQSIELNAESSSPSVTAQNLKYLWVVTGPNDSAMGPTAQINNQIVYKPDATGMHIFSVIARDNLDFCQIDASPFYVTANPVFKPENPLPDFVADKADLSMFWHLLHVGAKAAWQFATGEGMIIGVIDSGVDYNHSALANNILLNSGEVPDNGIDDDQNGFVDDYVGYDFGQDDAYPFDDFGHGTHVAGIAASNIFGAARKAKILATKFGAGLGFDIASVTGAIKYEVDRGAKVLNMSFGWEEDLQVVREALDYAELKGTLVIAAAGNEANNNDNKPSYPDSYPNKNIISVAATDENDTLTTYSNYGVNRVHLAAPGGTEAKPIVSSYKKNPRNAEFMGLMGTSMAAPLVAGVAAEIWSAHPHLTNIEIRQILLDTGKPSAGLVGQIQTGKVVDAVAAMTAVIAKRDGQNTRPVLAGRAIADGARLPSSVSR